MSVICKDCNILWQLSQLGVKWTLERSWKWQENFYAYPAVISMLVFLVISPVSLSKPSMLQQTLKFHFEIPPQEKHINFFNGQGPACFKWLWHVFRLFRFFWFVGFFFWGGGCCLGLFVWFFLFLKLFSRIHMKKYGKFSAVQWCSLKLTESIGRKGYSVNSVLVQIS